MMPENPNDWRPSSSRFVAMENSSENPAFNNNKMTYVKRKSNQLVAVSTNPPRNGVVQSNNNTNNSYYVRSKNKLIRKPLDKNTATTTAPPPPVVVRPTPPTAMAVDNSDSELTGQRLGGKRSYEVAMKPCQPSKSSHVWTLSGSKSGDNSNASNTESENSLSRKRPYKVAVKTRKPSKSSLVWTLNGSQASTGDSYSMHAQSLANPVSWKRATYSRSMKRSSAPIGNSLSTISWKLQLLRRRDTVYTRSANGFSLRKSKVLSIGGANLKWSKSIDRNSKKANEQATLAVIAAQRVKREQDTARPVAWTKNINSSSRGCIFRIGSSCYKMDPVRRTLRRISGDESSRLAASPSGNNAKKSYVPRRLIIGNDQYVRIGNGNQLIRDPKKRARVLASQKIRSSLHTARLRLVRKRKYCQFFTRFGTCNKDDGKCPYIHDPSKIVVCTKFLNGLCSNPNCKLTHQVIPERMPDCSFFVQGLCTHRSCSYRHVHVNPNAPVCEAFLKGYCADGDECRKKHSYVCPTFEATGLCPQGSKCKLHHPKIRSKGPKNKRARNQNTLGRYFGSTCVDIYGPGTAVLAKHSVQGDGSMIFEGTCDDYIPLGVADEEPGVTNDQTSRQVSFCDANHSDLETDELDMLIKPTDIMRTLIS